MPIVVKTKADQPRYGERSPQSRVPGYLQFVNACASARPGCVKNDQSFGFFETYVSI
jgi:hypothetical protein